MQTLIIQNIYFVASIILCGSALAQPQPGHRPIVPPHEHAEGDHGAFWGRDHLLGDLGGARSWLIGHGVTPEATLIADASRNFAGGQHDAGTFRHLFDLSIAFDMDLLAGIEGGVVFIDFQTQEGQDGSAETGDLQAYSNIDAEDFTVLYELWYEQVFADGRVRIKAGKMDANADFAFVENGGEFINSSAGFSPTLLTLPTYPDPALGVAGFVEPEGLPMYLGIGIYDGATQQGLATGSRGFGTLFDDPADLFLIGELGLTWTLGPHALPGRVALGGWHHTGAFDRFDGGIEDGTSGFYLVYEQLIFRESEAAEGDDQGLGVFAQYGWADDRVSPIDHHLGAGVQRAGLVPGRDVDIAGVMVSSALLSDKPGAGFSDGAETAIEVFYKAQITPWFSVKPDLQYIVNPGGSGQHDAWVGTLRFELVF